MARAFDDLGQSPFGHKRRQKAALLARPIAAPKEETNDYKEPSHDTADPTEQLTVTPPPEPTIQAEESPSEDKQLSDDLPPMTHLAAASSPKRNLLPRKLLSWGGTDLGISPFKGRRRLQALVDATISDTSRPKIERPTAASSSSESLNGSVSAQDPQPGSANTPTLSAPRSSLDSELEGLTLSSSLETTHAPSDSVVKPRVSVFHALVKNKARSLTVKKALTPQPFLNTYLGRVPPEVREIIWEYLLISPTSKVLVKYPESDAQSQPEGQCSSKATRRQVWPILPKFGGINGVNILCTCRLVREEGHHIFFSKNSFRFTRASDLLEFLAYIGSGYRQKLTSFHLGGLLGQKLRYSERHLDIYCEEGMFGSGRRDSLAREIAPCLHPDAKKAGKMLKECKHLKSIDIEMKVGEEIYIIEFLQAWHGFYRTAVDFSDDFSWAVRPTRFREGHIWGVHHFYELARPSGPSWGRYTLGNDRLVNVTIVSSECAIGSESSDDDGWSNEYGEDDGLSDFLIEDDESVTGLEPRDA